MPHSGKRANTVWRKRYSNPQEGCNCEPVESACFLPCGRAIALPFNLIVLRKCSRAISCSTLVADVFLFIASRASAGQAKKHFSSPVATACPRKRSEEHTSELQ